MTESRSRRSGKDRARKRAIRAKAAEHDVPYSVAARWLATPGIEPGCIPASHGRTVYPPSSDSHRRWLIECRERRSFSERVRDARLAADIPTGRARHLVDRFPPTRGEPGTGVGLLYHGAAQAEMLALLYAVVAHESPGIVPTVGDLAWIAELGEETAVDTACTEIDRMVRLLLDDDHATVMGRIEDMLSAEERHHNWRIHGEIVRLAAAYDTVIRPYGRMGSEPVRVGLPLDGVRHILDALLVIADDGHAPGTRVRIMPAPYNGWNGTIVGIVWGPTGPPLRYNVHPDAASEPIFVAPRDLVVVSSTEVGLGWPQV